jgi:hypothetical protein
MIVSLCRDGGETGTSIDIPRRIIGGSQTLHCVSNWQYVRTPAR